MRRVLILLAVGAASAFIGGCASQSVVVREFYEPTDRTIVHREDGIALGALKSETLKSGSPDWSGSKAFSLIGVGR